MLSNENIFVYVFLMTTDFNLWKSISGQRLLMEAFEFSFSKKDLSLHSFCKYVRGQLSCSHTVSNISDVQTATCCFCSGSNSHTFLKKNITSIRYFLVFELLQRDRREHGDCSFQSTSKRLTYTDVTFSVFVVCTTLFFERKQILSMWFQNISSFMGSLWKKPFSGRNGKMCRSVFWLRACWMHSRFYLHHHNHNIFYTERVIMHTRETIFKRWT